MQIKFLVQGSTPEPYEVIFIKEGNNLSATCDCRAGLSGLHCKHRLSILDGSAKNIVSDNPDDVQEIQFWLNGTELEAALSDFNDAEEREAAAKKELSAAKRRIAQIMGGK